MKDLLNVIDYLLTDVNKDNITINDLNNLKEGLEISDAQIRINRFYDEYQSHTSTIKLIQDIDKEINQIKEKILKREQELEQFPVNKGSLTIEVLNHMQNALIEIKNDIANNNNSRITNFLELPKYSHKQKCLIKECVESMGVSYIYSPEYFGKPIAQMLEQQHEYVLYPETVNKIYDIVSNKKLVADLKKNLPIKKYEEQLKEELHVLEDILTYKPDLELIITLSKELQTLNNEYTILNQEKSRLIEITNKENETLQKSKSNPLKIILNNKQLRAQQEQLNLNSNKIEELSKKIEINTDRSFQLDKKINKIYANKINSSSSLQNKKDTILSIESLVNLSKSELVTKINEINSKIKDITYEYSSKETEKLLNEDYKSCEKTLALLTAEVRFELTPIICLYVLKLLVDSRTTREISPDSKYNTAEYQKLSQQTIINTNNNFRDRIKEETNLDEIIKKFHEYDKVKIKKLDF